MSKELPKTPLDEWIERKHVISLGSRDELLAYQERRIAETVKKAKEQSAFYSRLYKGISVPKCTEEFQRLPFTTSDDLRRFGAELLTSPQRDIARIVTLDTSGTSGEPKRVFFTEEDQELTIDYFANGMRVMTEPGYTVGVFLPCRTRGSVGDLLSAGLERCETTPVRHGMITELSSAADAFSHCDSLVGVPVQILALAEYCRLNAIETHVKTLLLSTDNVPESIKHRLSNLLDAEVFEHFGMTETGLGCAIDCAAHKGLHVRENDLYTEVIDSGGRTVCDGVWGELVITTLTRNGMPFIRYRTGDRARMQRDRCPCGSVLARIDLKGRMGKDELRLLDEKLFAIDGVVDYKLVDGETVLVTAGGAVSGYKCIQIGKSLLPYTGKRSL